MIISRQVVPHGGWVYMQGDIRLIGSTFDDLVRSVKVHRYHNGIPAGDIEKDIEEQIAEKFPDLKRSGVLS